MTSNSPLPTPTGAIYSVSGLRKVADGRVRDSRTGGHSLHHPQTLRRAVRPSSHGKQRRIVVRSLQEKVSHATHNLKAAQLENDDERPDPSRTERGGSVMKMPNYRQPSPTRISAAADAPVATPVAEPTPEPVAAAPEPDPDFTFATLENGQREMRLATGQVYRGKDDAELYGQLAKAQIAASRRITELSQRPEPIAPIPVAAPPDAIDPTALAIADLMAPAFGVKNGAELVAAFAEQQRIANAQQDYMAAQQVNMEAANFFRAVPEFSKAQADADKIDEMCRQNGWSPTAANFEAAYYTLKAKGEMAAAQPASSRATAPRNTMPPPPTGTGPANTGKGAPTEQDLWAMSTEDLEQLITGQLTQ